MVRNPQKIRNIFPILLVILLFAFSASPVKAEIYKCENAKGKIIYSDTPCHSSSTQTVTDIQTDVDTNQNGPQSAESSVMRQLDSAVKSAIAAGDFIRADALAITKEHYEWIAAAKKDAAKEAVTGRTEADLIAEKSSSDECIQAKLSLEKEANSSFPKSDVLAAKTSLMRAACGLSDEAGASYSNPVYVNRNIPFLFNPYRYYSYKNLGHYPHKARPGHPTSPPHDRPIVKDPGAKNPEGKRIMTEDTPK